VHRIFMECKWSSSFGGVAWGKIALMVLEYLRGNLSHTLFVDACFNLKHNGGCAFGKFDWMLGGNVGLLLDTKTTGNPATLYAVAAINHNSIYEYETRHIGWHTHPVNLKEYSAAESIFIN
jgi:hypothetical protein